MTIGWIVDAEPGFVGGRWIREEGAISTTKIGTPSKYIGKIFLETKNRPTFIIKEKK